jgi:hypothetical protein
MLERPSDYAHLYSILGRYLAEGYGVVYAVESDPEYVVQKMVKVGLTQVDRHLADGTLKILPIESIYVFNSNKVLDGPKTIESWMRVISKTIQDTKVKGVIAIGSLDSGAEWDSESIEHVLEYEKQTGKKFQSPIEAVCVYTADALCAVPVSTIITILNAHQYTIHDNSEYSEWSDDKLREVLASAFDKVLGMTTSALVRKTLQSVYKLDERSIISDPALLEQVLASFFRDSSTVILAAITKNLKSEIAFHRQQNHQRLQQLGNSPRPSAY